jgi:hypothetical protein
MDSGGVIAIANVPSAGPFTVLNMKLIYIVLAKNIPSLPILPITFGIEVTGDKPPL